MQQEKNLTREALEQELWNMLPDDCKAILSPLKKSYIESLMADIDSYFATQHSRAVWVKADVRLPDKSGHITWRWLDKTEAYAGYDEKKGFIFGTGGARVDPTYYSEIEWLDESGQSKEGIGWIKAEAKPEHNVGVLVFIPGEDNHITSGMWDISNEWVLLDEYRTPEEEVTHWMPLPAAPEGYKHDMLSDELVSTLKAIAKEELAKRPSKEGNKDREIDIDELWDQHSALIGDDIDDLSYWSGKEVMKKEYFVKTIEQIQKQKQ